MARKEGDTNLKSRQWAEFCTYCLEGGLAKFQREIDKLEGTEYVDRFTRILDFQKPRLAKMAHTGGEEKDMPIILTWNDPIKSTDLPENTTDTSTTRSEETT